MGKLYAIKTYGGYIRIEMARTKNQARKSAEQFFSGSEIKEVSPATEEEIAWVKAMGGHVPEKKGN